MGFILITCQEDDQIIVDNEIAVEKKAAQSTFGNLPPEYLLDMIGNIKEMVSDGILNKGRGNALISKINNAIKGVNKGNTNAVNGQLGALINQVEALINTGSLTPQQGQLLIKSTENALILSDGDFVDPNDGHAYPVVLIGEQLWMAENLKATSFSDGTQILQVTDQLEWDNLTTPGYSWYDNDESTYGNKYGAIYNWYAVETEKLCPAGWHVPDNTEWTQLIDFLSNDGHAGAEGIALKSTSGWDGEGNGTNDYGFTALPSGSRDSYWSHSFWGAGLLGYWWSSSEFAPEIIFSRTYYMSIYIPVVETGVVVKDFGVSVRCVRD